MKDRIPWELGDCWGTKPPGNPGKLKNIVIFFYFNFLVLLLKEEKNWDLSEFYSLEKWGC